jgi:transposase
MVSPPKVQQEDQEMSYLGIDQHRKQLTVELWNETGDAILKRQVSTEWKRVREFLKDLRTRANPEGGFVAIVEVCGFNDWLLKLLAEYSCRETILIQPEKRSSRKTDRRDAHDLVQTLWVNRQRLLAGEKVRGIRRVRMPAPQDAEARQVTWMRKRLGVLRTRTINKIKHILRKHNLEQECPTKGLNTVRGKQWLTQLSLGPIDRMEMDQLLTQWKLWEEQIQQVEAEIVRRQPKSETAAILATIPGCAAYGSLALAARLDPVERFPNRGSLANYWGLTPRCRNSGEATERLGSITKQGSAMARFILSQLVLHVLRRDPWMKEWFGRIKRRRGAKIARVAVMRRLADIIEQMVKHRQPYVNGRPWHDKQNDQTKKLQPANRSAKMAREDFQRDSKVSKGRKKHGLQREVPVRGR